MGITAVTILGAIIGSFLSVCIYRVPLRRFQLLAAEGEYDLTDEEREEIQKMEIPEGISISYPPRSFCPECKTQLEWWHNIPVISWLLLAGKCAACKAPISVRYPVVELLSAGFALLSVASFGFSATALVIYLFCAALIVISFIDIDHFIIPDVISYPGMVFGLLLSVVNQFTGWFMWPVNQGALSAFYGVLAGAGFLWAVAKLYQILRKKDGLGLGDVKLLAMTGALFGPEAALYTIFMGSLLGTFIGSTMILVSGKSFAQHLPFGPYLAGATLLYLFTGNSLLLEGGKLLARLLGGQV